ncbi:MAG: DNA-binding protein [Flavobacteriales bacterium]|nr:DNA-binding protein [Flavobacteriales bacterium]|tara:strand:- start:5234 stop:5608 length:375 start_codon:yes stop_codon:yes gene_type:complete
MSDNRDEIYSKSLRAGRRTYFFDVRSTRADDFYLTITESKREFNEDGTPFYKKHKIYLYKEDFQNFKDHLNEMVDYIIKERGEEIISLNKEEKSNTEVSTKEKKEEPTTDFTEVNFDDLGKEEE